MSSLLIVIVIMLWLNVIVGGLKASAVNSASYCKAEAFAKNVTVLATVLVLIESQFMLNHLIQPLVGVLKIVYS